MSPNHSQDPYWQWTTQLFASYREAYIVLKKQCRTKEEFNQKLQQVRQNLMDNQTRS